MSDLDEDNVIDINSVRALVAKGESPEAIAIKYGYDLEEISKHTAPLKDAILDERTILERYLRTCNALCEIAQTEYQSDSTDRKAYAVTTFMQTAQGILKDLATLKNNDEKVSQLVETVIQPLVRSAIRIIGNEVSTVISIMGPNQKAKEALTALAENFGKDMTTEYRQALGKLGDIFDCKFDIAGEEPQKEKEVANG